MRIIPAIDIIDGQCVRLTQGDFSQKKVYHSNPVDVAKNFEAAGLRYLHLVDLDGAKVGSVMNWEVVQEITTRTQLQVDFGGGIKTEKEIRRLLNLGVSQINLGSIAVKQPGLIKDWIKTFGPEKIILSADVKDGFVQIAGWLQNTQIGIEEFISTFNSFGIKYVTCTDITTDGMLAGPNFNLYKTLIEKFPEIHWIASGGVSALDDLGELSQAGLFGVIIGKAIYENKVGLDDLNQGAFGE